MNVKPLNDRILVVRTEGEQKTAGGIIIPDTAKEKPMEGKVVAAGPGKLDEKGNRVPMELKVGDRVLFSKYAGTEIKIDGVEHLFMREDDILGVIE
ncbi:Cpn10 chaperonin GroES, small subunit of GroESL [Desulfosarcina cetonica]|uniref:co-chaperone GroES n=1 Tax=Desulfosarcina cetonica TaxID=90730 RepID=UPI0006D1F8C4|nr:co-chaperone GroES [Desulfosarcina cetonica]VTR68364.1 Cpn10 chaperonin GroES, small subunit of GroESL [Desulfosarcina cetonica]